MLTSIDALFKSRLDTRSIDSLFIQYLVTLAFDFKSSLCIPKLLYYLRMGQRRQPKPNEELPVPVEILAFCEPLVFVALSKSLHLWPLTPTPDSSQPDIRKSLIILLLASMSDCSNPKLNPTEQKQRAVASFLLALAESGHAQYMLSGDKEPSRKEIDAFEPAIGNFARVMEPIDAVLVRDLLNSYTSIFETIKHPNSSVETFLKPTRLFRMIWLESRLLVSRQTQTDVFAHELQFFLVNENPLKLISHLVTASFDGLSVSLLRKDSSMNIGLWKAFIVKRLPLIIKDLLSAALVNVNPTQIENIICQPITSLSRDTINLIRRPAGNDSIVDEMFPTAGAQNTMSDIRFDLIKAFVSLNILNEHAFQVIQEDKYSYSIPRIDEMALLNDGLIVDKNTGNSFYIQEQASIAMNENSEYVAFEDSTITRLVNDFFDLDGIYQARVAEELVKMLNFWIEGGNTRNVSRICQALSLNLNSLDVLLLYVKPSDIYRPLVKLLDDWRHDEEEVNYQEIYTDFGCILLMVVLGFERHHLSFTDLGLEGGEQSFCVSVLRQTCTVEKPLDDLSDETQELLGGWISALFEAGAISDDLMKMSAVKEFYALVPSLFRQAVAACSATIIDLDNLRGGLEYFLQPFLLPSLLGAFVWIRNSIWRQQSDTMTLLQIINTLLTSELEGEAQNIHRIVLSIAANFLYPVLTRISHSAGSAEEQLFVEPKILSILDPYYTASSSSANTLLEQHGSLESAIKEHITVLTNWSMSSLDTSPPGYNSDLLGKAVGELGASHVISILLDHLDAVKSKPNNTGGNNEYESAIDVITALAVLLGQATSQFLVGTKHDSDLIQTLCELRDEDVVAVRRFYSRPAVFNKASISDAKPAVKTLAGKYNGSAAKGATPAGKDKTASDESLLVGFKRLQANANAFMSRRRAMEARK